MRGQAGRRWHEGADKVFRAQQETIEFAQVMEKEIRKEGRKRQTEPCGLHCYRRWNANENKCAYSTDMHTAILSTCTCTQIYKHNKQWQLILFPVSLSHSPVNFSCVVWIESATFCESTTSNNTAVLLYFVTSHSGFCTLFRFLLITSYFLRYLKDEQYRLRMFTESWGNLDG